MRISDMKDGLEILMLHRLRFFLGFFIFSMSVGIVSLSQKATFRVSVPIKLGAVSTVTCVSSTFTLSKHLISHKVETMHRLLSLENNSKFKDVVAGPVGVEDLGDFYLKLSIVSRSDEKARSILEETLHSLRIADEEILIREFRNGRQMIQKVNDLSASDQGISYNDPALAPARCDHPSIIGTSQTIISYYPVAFMRPPNVSREGFTPTAFLVVALVGGILVGSFLAISAGLGDGHMVPSRKSKTDRA